MGNREAVSGDEFGNPLAYINQRASPLSEYNSARDTYDEQKQEVDYLNNLRRQQSLFNNFNNSDWAQYDKNINVQLGKNDANGNLNDLDFGDTLNDSRSADALNNQRHWVHSDIGSATSKYGTSAPTLAHSERWEPIETQETRQMRQNERITEQARTRDVNRQANVRDYPLELRKIGDLNISQLAQQIGISEVQLGRFMQQAQISAQYTQNWQQWYLQNMAQFTQELTANMNSRVALYVNSFAHPYNEFMSRFMNPAGFGLDQNEVISNRFKNAVLDRVREDNARLIAQGKMTREQAAQYELAVAQGTDSVAGLSKMMNGILPTFSGAMHTDFLQYFRENYNPTVQSQTDYAKQIRDTNKEKK